jgi:hypothetical protein
LRQSAALCETVGGIKGLGRISVMRASYASPDGRCVTLRHARRAR